MATQLNNTYLASGGTLALGFGTSATRVYGSVDADTVTIAAGVTVVLDGSFNRGNDTIKFTGNASSYSIVRVNASTVQVTDASGTSVTIPVGSAGTKIQFADATRTLSGSSAGIVLGDQAVTSTAAPLAQGTSPAGEFILTSSAPTVTEGSNGTKTLTYLLQLNKAPTSELSLNYQTTDAGTAQAGDDFQVVAGLVTFAAGQTAATVSVTVYGDTTVEADETVVLRVSGSKLVASVDAVGTIVSDDINPDAVTSYTVSAGDIAAANAADVPAIINVGNTGDKTVAIQSDGASATKGVIVNGNADVTVTSGAGNDKITLTGNGDNTVNVGTGNDVVSIFGSGANTVVFGSGSLKAGDAVTGGTGVDTVVISGDGNVIAFDANGDGVETTGAVLNGVEKLVLNGTTLTVSALWLEQVLADGSITGILASKATSVLTITDLDQTEGDTLDISGLAFEGGFKSILTTGTGTLILNTAQKAAAGAISAKTGTLTQVVIVAGDQTVAQAQALIAAGETAKFALVDTADALARAPAAVFAKAVSVEATTDATAAQAVQIAGVIAGSANSSIFANSVVVDAAVKVSVTDTASMLANNVSGLAIADKVTATTAATVAEAKAIVGANTAGKLFTASYAVADTVSALTSSSALAPQYAMSTTQGSVNATTSSTANLAVGMTIKDSSVIPAGTTITSIVSATEFTLSKAALLTSASVGQDLVAPVLNGATSVTIVDAASAAGVAAINTALTTAVGGLTKVAAGYSLTDTASNLTASGAAAVTAAAGGIKVSTNGSALDELTVAEATAVELLANTGTNSYKLADTALALRNASAAVVTVGSLNGAKLTDGTVTVANFNALVAQFGNAAFSDSATVTDTAAELVKLSPAALLENGVTAVAVTGTATVAQLTALNAFLTDATTGGRLVIAPAQSAVNIRDTADNLAAAILDPATRKALDLAGTVTVTGAATVKQIADINEALSTNQTDVEAGYTLVDTAENLAIANSVIVNASSKVTVSDAATVVQIETIDTAFATKPVTATVTTTSGSANVTTASTVGLSVGSAISGTGIPAGATISSITNATTFVISANATATGSVSTTLAYDGVLGVDIVYALQDAVGTLVADGSNLETAAATSVQLVSPVVSTAQAGTLTDATKFPLGVAGGFVIEGDAAAIAAATTTLLGTATKVVLVDAIGSLFTNGQPVAAAAKADEVIASTAVANAATLALNPDASKVSGFRITDSTTVANAAAVNALSAINSTTYAVTGTFAELMASGSALATFVQKATTITPSDASLTVAQFNALDARAGGTVVEAIVDTAAALASDTASAAVAAARLNGLTVTVSTATTGSTFVSVEQAKALIAKDISGYTIVDTAANITAAGDAVLLAKRADGTTNRASLIVINDGGEVTLSVAAALVAFDSGSGNDDGNAAATYNLVDTAANLAAAPANMVGFAKNVTATTAANIADAATLASAARNPMGTLTYDLSDTILTNLFTGSGATTAVTAAANKARNITIDVLAPLTVAEATALKAATNTGTESYRISDTALNIGGPLAGDATTGLVSSAGVAAINAATGTVVVTGTAANAVQATRIAAYTKGVVYDVADTAAGLVATTVSAGAINEARDITVAYVSTDATTIAATTVTAALATKLLAATNTGTTTIGLVSATAAQAAALTLTSNDVITTLNVTGIATAAQAATIWAKDVGANITTINFVSVTGTASELAALALNPLQAGILTNTASGGVVATTAATAAQAAAIYAASNTAVYDIADTFANLMLDTNITDPVDRSAAIVQGDMVTVTDAIDLAQAKQAVVTGGGSADQVFELADVYTIVDTDSNILTAMGTSDDAAILFKADAVTLANGTSLQLDYIGSASVNGTLHIVGTRSEIEALPASMATAKKLLEVSVADLVANPTYFTTLPGNVNYRVVDTYANLTSGNTLIAQADGITVIDDVTVAQAAIARALIADSGEVSFSLQDTAANLLAPSAATILTDSVNVSATTAVTVAQAGTILTAVGLTGTASYSISQSDAVSITSGDNAALKAATNITITATVNGSINATEAALLLGAKNSGSTVISKVNGTLTELQTLLPLVGANDRIGSIELSATTTVANLRTLDGLATAVVYSLTDTAANLVAATDIERNAATSLTLSGTATTAKATVAQLIVLDAATPPLTAAISDTAANILAASPTLLAAYDTTAIVVSGAISAATAAELNSFENLNGLNVNVEGAQLTDTSANLLLIENASLVAAATKVTVSDVMTTARASLVIAAVNTGGSDTALTSAGLKFDLSDSYANLALASATANLATKVTITNTIGAAQAKTADDWAGTAVYDNVRDTATNVANATFAAALAKAKTVTLTTDATVAQAGRISEMANVTSYAIKDNAENVYNALNTINGLNVADRKSVLGAASVTVTDLVSVVQAVGDAGTDDAGEKLGLGTVPGAVFSVIGSAASIAAALRDPAKAPALLNATTVELTDGSEAKVADLTLIADILGSAFLYDVNYDVNGESEGTSVYRINDTFGAIQRGDASLVAGAAAVVANGTNDVADVIDMSGFSIGMTINGGTGVFADTITGTSLADAIDGGDGNDTITGGAGLDALDGGAGTADIVSYSDVTAATSHSLSAVAGIAVNLSAAAVTAGTIATAMGGTVVIGGGAGAAGGDLAAGTAGYLAATAAGSTTTMVRDTLVRFEGVTGSALSDYIALGAGGMTAIGGAGADTIIGGAGVDTVSYADVTAATSHGLSNVAGIAVNLSAAAVTAGTIATAMGGTVVIGGGAGVAGGDLAAGTAGYLAATAAGSTATMVRDTLTNFENVTGSALNDYIVLGAGTNTITGGLGADVMGGGADLDTFVIAAGDSVLTVGLGGASTASSVTGADRIIDFVKASGTVVSESLDVAGVASVRANGTIDIATTTNVTVNNSGTSTVFASLVVTNGIAVFHNNDTPGGNTAIALTSSNIAGAISALQGIDLGDTGTTLGFMGDFDGDGVDDDFAVFTQGSDAGTNNLDTLVYMLNSGSVTSLITDGTAVTANAVHIM